MSKQFIVSVSFTGRMDIMVDAESEEEAKELVFDNITGDFKSLSDCVLVEQVEWDLLEHESRGNIREPYVEDMVVEELED